MSIEIRDSRFGRLPELVTFLNDVNLVITGLTFVIRNLVRGQPSYTKPDRVHFEVQTLSARGSAAGFSITDGLNDLQVHVRVCLSDRVTNCVYQRVFE